MKKKAHKKTPGHAKRLDPAEFGVDPDEVLAEIREHLSGTHAEIAERSGLATGSVTQILGGFRAPSLGALAALARAAGGKLDVRFVPGAKRKGKRE